MSKLVSGMWSQTGRVTGFNKKVGPTMNFVVYIDCTITLIVYNLLWYQMGRTLCTFAVGPNHCKSVCFLPLATYSC